MRMCIGCRERAAKTELVRFVLEQGRVIPDPHGRLPGRGASLHPDPGCLELAERRRAFARALRHAGPVDLTAVREHLEDRWMKGSTSQDGHPPVPNGSGSRSDEHSMSTQR